MTTMNVMNPRLDWFRQKMGEKLGSPKNVAKADPRLVSVPLLMKLLLAEVRELSDAILASDTPDQIISECCDVANFASMIADKFQFRADCICIFTKAPGYAHSPHCPVYEKGDKA